MHIPVTLRRQSDLGRFPLDEYTHILMPGGGSTPSKQATETLKLWVRSGGTLVATKAASIWAQRTMINGPLADGKKSKDVSGDMQKPKTVRVDYAEKSVKDAEHLIGGALFASDLDVTHPLGFGFADRSLATMKASTTPLAPSDDPYAVVAAYAEEPLLSGYASKRRTEELAGTPMLLAETYGRGSLILFADDPAFRATFLGADKLVMNAIFFGDHFEKARQP
jgi:hypothetical protein